MTWPKVPETIDAVSPDWLTAALREGGCLPSGTVAAVEATPIGEGRGMLSQIARLHLTYDASTEAAPDHLVVKLPALAPENRHMSMAYGLYQREARFYLELAARVPLRSPRCFAAILESETGEFALLLEDLSGGRVIDQLDGCSVDVAEVVITQVARLHASWWQHADLESLRWIPDGTQADVLAETGNLFRMVWPRYLARFGDDCPTAVRIAGDELAQRFEEMQLKLMQAPVTLCHGDLRLDNLFFDLPVDPLVAVDWQIMRRSRGMLDTAYFISMNLEVDVRRQHEQDLLRRYHDELLACGVREYSFEQCLDDYRRALLDGLLGVAAASTLDTANARGAAWFQSMHERGCAANLDWETDKLLSQ